MIIFESILTTFEPSVVFETSGAIVKFGSSLEPNHLKQIRFVQIRNLNCTTISDVSCIYRTNYQPFILYNTFTRDTSKAGMNNIRPAGQMWPAEAFNLARKTPNFVYFASFFWKKTPFECVKTYHLWPLDMSKKNLGPPWDLSCAPLF